MLIGRITLEIAPSGGNPRNSEGAFITLRDGRIMFAYTKFYKNAGADDSPACIAARYSADGGDTWSDERVIFMPDDLGVDNIMSVSLLRMEDGALGLMFIIKRTLLDTRLYLYRSHDEGENFDDGTACIIAPGYYVTNNDRVIRLASGRIVVPANLHRKTYGNHRLDMRGTGYFYLSDDDGRTWREAQTACYPPDNISPAGLQETGVIEIRPGLIWAWFRTALGCQYQSWSHDGGEIWTPAQPASFFSSPCSPMSVKRLCDGRLFAVWNPVPQYTTRPQPTYRDRTPFVCSVSSDDGRSWSAPQTIEGELQKGGYCYTAIFPQDGYVLIGYCAGQDDDGGCLDRLRIRRIDYGELA